MRSGVPWQNTVGMDIEGKTLGVLGLGKLGARAAGVAKAFGMKVIAWSQNLTPERCKELGVEYASKDDLFRNADIVTIHLQLSDRTRGLVTAKELGLMKKTAYLVNTSRGSVANLDHVLAALDSGQLDCAGLDVLPKEPPEADHAVLRHPRVLLTPHAAFYSVEGERALRRKAAQNLVDWARTGRPTYVVSEGR